MKSILSKQSSLQSKYSGLEHYDPIDPSNPEDYTVGEVYNYIQQMQFFMNEEINELLLELGDGNRAIHKPWSTQYLQLRNKSFSITEETKNEAIDALCFLMNIMLVAGISPENVDQEYNKVLLKNLKRQKDTKY